MQNASMQSTWHLYGFRGTNRCRHLGWLPLLGMVAWGGCGANEGPKRVVVEGAVSYQDQPVANGQIYFYPITQGPVSGGPIKDGHYQANARGGVPIGKYRVEIMAYRAPPASPGGAVSEGMPPVQYLPPKFNTTTELTMEVDGSNDPATHDFHLSK